MFYEKGEGEGKRARVKLLDEKSPDGQYFKVGLINGKSSLWKDEPSIGNFTDQNSLGGDFSVSLIRAETKYSAFELFETKIGAKIGVNHPLASSQSGANLSYDLRISAVKSELGFFNSWLGADVSSGMNIGHRGLSVKLAGNGITINREEGIKIDTSIGGIGINIEEMKASCVIM